MVFDYLEANAYSDNEPLKKLLSFWVLCGICTADNEPWTNPWELGWYVTKRCVLNYSPGSNPTMASFRLIGLSRPSRA